MIEVEVFGIDDATVKQVRALPGVTSVSVEDRDQAQVLTVQSPHGLELTGAADHLPRRHRIGRIAAREPTLEDAYVALVTGSPDEDGMKGYPRIVWVGLFSACASSRSRRWFILMAVIEPVIFATIAFYLFQEGGRSGTLLYAALGAAMMGIWSSTLFGSGGALQWNRWQGTLELLVGAPPPFIVVLLPLTVATSLTGAYALVATLLWGRLFFGVPLHFANPAAFAVAVPAAILALGLMGLLMASSFVLYRHANALSNLLEYPVWIATGLLFPIALLPGWVRPISWVLAPTWGIRAMRHAALGGGTVWFPILMCTLLGIAYFVLAGVFLRIFEKAARARATLSLT